MPHPTAAHTRVRIWATLPCAWIVASAFASNSRWLAARPILRIPAALLLVLTEALLQSLYRSADGHGVVALRRNTRWCLVGAVLGAIGILTAPIAAIAIASCQLHPPAATWIAGPLFAYLILSLLVSIARPTGTTLQREVREMGEHDAWTIPILAQRPGTNWSALELARDLVAALVPDGDKITITAREPRLETIYRRAGFTSTGNRAMTATAPLTNGSPTRRDTL